LFRFLIFFRKIVYERLCTSTVFTRFFGVLYLTPLLLTTFSSEFGGFHLENNSSPLNVILMFPHLARTSPCNGFQVMSLLWFVLIICCCFIR